MKKNLKTSKSQKNRIFVIKVKNFEYRKKLKYRKNSSFFDKIRVFFNEKNEEKLKKIRVFTVSQICKFTDKLSSIFTTFEIKSVPTVVSYFFEKVPF